jgi:acid phosphatase (class A)
LLLPPPPADGSSAQAAELAELHRIENARTAVAFARADTDAKSETVTMFAETLGPSFDIAKLPATAYLFDRIAVDEETISKKFKLNFHRNRPYVADPTLHHCGHGTVMAAQTSYPSGHTSVAYVMGAILADLNPNRAQAILARSADFAENRLVCGVHYRSDIEAGHVVGMLIAERLQQNAEFQAAFQAAKAELTAVSASGP